MREHACKRASARAHEALRARAAARRARGRASEERAQGARGTRYGARQNLNRESQKKTMKNLGGFVRVKPFLGAPSPRGRPNALCVIIFSSTILFSSPQVPYGSGGVERHHHDGHPVCDLTLGASRRRQRQGLRIAGLREASGKSTRVSAQERAQECALDARTRRTRVMSTRAERVAVGPS